MNNPPDVANTIKAYAKLKKLQTGQMLQDCGLNKNALSTMQSRGTYPGVETIGKIADYLDCSVDYLLGRTDNPEVNK